MFYREVMHGEIIISPKLTLMRIDVIETSMNFSGFDKWSTPNLEVLEINFQELGRYYSVNYRLDSLTAFILSQHKIKRFSLFGSSLTSDDYNFTLKLSEMSPSLSSLEIGRCSDMMDSEGDLFIFYTANHPNPSLDVTIDLVYDFHPLLLMSLRHVNIVRLRWDDRKSRAFTFPEPLNHTLTTMDVYSAGGFCLRGVVRFRSLKLIRVGVTESLRVPMGLRGRVSLALSTMRISIALIERPVSDAHAVFLLEHALELARDNLFTVDSVQIESDVWRMYLNEPAADMILAEI